MKMVILKKYPDKVFEILKECFPESWKIDVLNHENDADLIAEAEILIPSHVNIDRKMIESAPNLKIIQTGAGYDNIDLACCRENGIRVMNAPSVNTNEVAEHTFAFVFKWFKKIEELDEAIRKSGWSEKKKGKAFSDLTIGIVGYGNIGKKVSETAKIFGMKIFVYSKYYSNIEEGIIFTETLNELLKKSDIVTLHTAFSKEKTNMMSAREFNMMKKSSFFINTARGALVDEDALFRVLKEKKIAGAALDVFKKEPLPAGSPLRDLDNILFTPHNAGEPDLYNSYKKRFSFFSKNIQAVLDNKNPEGVIV